MRRRRTAGTSWLGDEKCHKVRPLIEEAATESLFQLALGKCVAVLREGGTKEAVVTISDFHERSSKDRQFF